MKAGSGLGMRLARAANNSDLVPESFLCLPQFPGQLLVVGEGLHQLGLEVVRGQLGYPTLRLQRSKFTLGAK